MARSKWISFTAQQSLNREAQKNAKPEITPTSALEVKKFGLENFGNTCYANSVLQALFFCAPFRDLVLQQNDPSVPLDLFATASVPPSSYVGPSKQPPTLAPVRRKPERKPSSSSYPAEALLPASTQPQAIPIPPFPPSLFSALRSLFYHISTQPGDKGSVAPKAFIEKLKELNDIFRSTMHQDAHEFLNFLLNQIVEEMEEERRQAQNAVHGEELAVSVATLSSKVPTVATTASSNSGTRPRDATLVHKLFEGVLTSETRCLTCETVSARDESFLDLSLDIEQNSSVTACLRHFSASEMLCQKNKFFCDSCCDLQEAEKRMKIKKLPNVLALHLKRFKYQEDVGRYIKLTYRVAFPMELRLFNTVDDMEDADRLYGLFAIVVHIGTGPHQGHYISIIKTGGSWFVFDDDAVYAIAESDITKYFGDSNSGSAYVLYYQAADLDPTELGLQPPKPPVVPISESSPTYQPLSTLGSDHIGPPPPPPPGLEKERLTSDDPASEARRTILEQPQLIIPDKPSIAIPPLVLTATPNAAEQLASSTPVTLPSPSVPGFGSKFFNTLRRAPSASLSRPGTSVGTPNGTERRRPGMERPSASSPSLSDKENGGLFTPPPVPPLPPIIQIPEPEFVANPPPEEKEKPRKESTKSGGWFLKRKSLKLGEKSKTQVVDPLVLPPSPGRQADGSGSTSIASGWFKSSVSSQRESQASSDHGPSRDPSFDVTRAQLKNGINQHLSVNGAGTEDTPPTPGSTTSSLNSASLVQPPFIHPLIGASSSTSSIPNLSQATPTSSANGLDRRKSKDSRSSSPAASRKKSSYSSKTAELERRQAPLPPTPSFISHTISPGNGHALTAEPKAYANGYHGYNEGDSSTASTSLTDSMGMHLRSATLPPPSSIAESMDGNTSTGSIPPPVTSGLRRATRKLSMTAPLLGFGKREKKVL